MEGAPWAYTVQCLVPGSELSITLQAGHCPWFVNALIRLVVLVSLLVV